MSDLADVLGIQPDDCERMLRSAADCFARGQLREAEVILVGLNHLSTDLRALKLLASTLYAQQRHSDAIRLYEDIVQRDDTDPFVLVALGELKLKSLRVAEALPVFRRLFELDPEGDHPAANRGRYLLQQCTEQLRQAGHR